MLHVGLTGNIASGKSTVATLFARWGAVVIDADEIVHELQRPGTAVFAGIVARFGPDLVRPDGTLDRAALRRRVLASPEDLAALNALVHPAVRERSAELVEQARRTGARIVVSVVPLLFESDNPARFDAIVLAMAGLTRLGRAGEVTQPFEAARFLPAPGQGVIALECRLRDTDVMAAVAPLHHAATHRAVQAERGFLAALGGGCNVPLGAYADGDGTMTLRAFVADPEGTRVLRAEKAGADPAELGRAVAGELISRGASALLGR